MTSKPFTCDPQRIEQFLEQRLSGVEQSAFESHLGDCGDCRHLLESAAVSEDVSWEICESLRNEPLLSDSFPLGDSDSTGEDASSDQSTILKLLAPTDDNRMLGRWGSYEVLGVVGSGGMGVVLKAFDAPLNRYVAILRVGMQAAAGLAAAHAQGLVHRDVKAANILLADGIERVKLTDFGLARAADDASLTKTGVIAGTPRYMSPEQARGEPVDPRSDLFSLGSVLYTMCTGRPPFRAETSYGVLRRITDEEPRAIREINPDIPEWLCDIVAKLMAKQPDDRFQTAQEVAALLQQCLAHVQQPTIVPLPNSVGEMSARLLADEIRGSYNTAADSQPNTPHMHDLSWARADGDAIIPRGMSVIQVGGDQYEVDNGPIVAESVIDVHLRVRAPQQGSSKATETKIIIVVEDVRVFAIGGAPKSATAAEDRKGRSRVARPPITLLVTQRQADIIACAAGAGTLVLVAHELHRPDGQPPLNLFAGSPVQLGERSPGIPQGTAAPQETARVDGNATMAAKLRIAPGFPVGTIAVSPDSKLLALAAQRFDKDGGTSTGGVSMVHAETGIEEWLVTVPGWAMPVAFSRDGNDVVVLCGDRSIRFLDKETGKLEHEIRSADSNKGTRWNDFAISANGEIMAIGGVDMEHKGVIELIASVPRRE